VKRFKYGLNSQHATSSKNARVAPLLFLEVAPGDTISGPLDVSAKSATTVGLVGNRAYLDIAVFYVPFRLLWSGWTDFISKKSGTIPTVANLSYVNFQNEYTVTPSASVFTELVPWNRRASNLIYNKFYKLATWIVTGKHWQKE